LQVDRDRQAADCWSRLLVRRALCGDPVELEVVTVASPVEWCDQRGERFDAVVGAQSPITWAGCAQTVPT